MIIRADLHTHTDRSSDGRHNLSALTAAARKAGLSAIAVTDHNVYSPLPEELNGVLLIPGCEFSTAAGHITGLFLQQPPRFGLQTPESVVAEIRRCGGIAVLAHPFQKPERRAEELDFALDAVETANARAAYRNSHSHEQAAAFAASRGLPAIGGSDAHSRQEIGYAYTEIDCAAPGMEAIKAALLAGQCKAVLRRETPLRRIGLSQLKRRRRMGGVKNLAIGLLFLGKCILKDLKP